MIKKFVLSFLLVAVCFSSVASAEIVGCLSILNITEEELMSKMKAPSFGDIHDEDYIGVDLQNLSIKYYDNLVSMLLALDKGEIDLINVIRPVGIYLLENNPELRLKGFNWWVLRDSYAFDFGFMEKNATLKNKFNDAITKMDEDGTLAILKDRYIENFKDLTPMQFEKFDNAETITVAITGDLPPIDYIAADGTPAGFNVAVLSEIAKRLHVNIKLMNIDAGARVAALTSGRADVIFWIEGSEAESYDSRTVIEKNEGIIISRPYYKWHEEYFIGKK